MSISTLSFNNINRSTLMKLKSEAADASVEMQTERHKDVGLSLGRLTGTAVSYRVDESSIDAQITTNKVTTSRLDQIQDVMTSLRATSDEMTSVSLVSTTEYSQYPELATSALKQLQDGLNTSVGGLYLFAGKNSDKAPIKDVDAGIAAAKAKFDDFLSAVGKTTATVTKEEMNGFLGGGYAVPAGRPRAGEVIGFMDTVNDANWQANWSTASDDAVEASISKSETIPSSVSANDQGFRKVVAAYSMLAAVKAADLGDGAKEALRSTATSTLTAGRDGVIALGALVGTRQNRVDAASEALTRQQDVVTAAFKSLEGVDATEAGLRFQNLETQLNAAYTITGRLQKLSILEYI